AAFPQVYCRGWLEFTGETARRRCGSTQYPSTQYSGTQYSILGTRYSVLNTQYSVTGTRYSILSNQYSVLGTQYSVLSTRYSVLGTQYSVLRTPLRQVPLSLNPRQPCSNASFCAPF